MAHSLQSLELDIPLRSVFTVTQNSVYIRYAVHPYKYLITNWKGHCSGTAIARRFQVQRIPLEGERSPLS
jgi:hypothetical protein